MGRSVTIQYTVEVKCAPANLGVTPCEWKTRARHGIPADGKPTAENLAKYVASYNASFEPGGVNAHCGPLRIVSARIVRQSDKTIMAEYKEPLFQVV